jgi:hypothetical protein
LKRKYEILERKRESERRTKEGYLEVEGEENVYDNEFGIIDDENIIIEDEKNLLKRNDRKDDVDLIYQSYDSKSSLICNINPIDFFESELNPYSSSGFLKRKMLDGDKEWWSFLHSLLLVFYFIFNLFFF